jgi:multidrug resistance protein
MNEAPQPKQKLFSRYQIFVIAILAILQFTVILDFMVLSPLGEILMRQIHITTSQFGVVVAAYAISAGISGLLSAGFADKYDRKKLLIFFYTGFLVGTLLCALAPGFYSLLAARIVTGIFGGVVGSVGGAIITDLFKVEVRGRVMGFVQMAFSASQVLGIPIGLALANRFEWHAPFWLIVIFGLVVGIIIVLYLKPVDAHLSVKHEHSAFAHLQATATNRSYIRAFLATMLLATGGFMMMPFASAFTTNNVGISLKDLPWLYFVTGVLSAVTGPLIGLISDKIGKYKVFVAGSILSAAMVIIYTHLGITPLWIVIVINVVMFAGIMSRIITSSALMMAVPEMRDRGAFMSINASTQYLAGGIASAIAGLIVVRTPSNKVEHYDTLGYVVIASMFITVVMMYFLNRFVQQKMAGKR